MIYSIFIYNSSSGLLMWDKTFEDISHGKAEMFSSFFSAIKSFVQEMVLKGENTLKTIEMGNYILKITNIKVKNKKSAIDLVLIADKDDEKKLKKVVPGITKVILDRSALFEDWIGGERKIFNVMDQPIVEAISKVKGLLTSGKSILDDQSEVLHSIWNKKKDEKVIDPEIIGNLNKEREFLFSKINDTTKIVKKIELINNVIVIDQKLRDETRFIEDQNLKIKFDKEFSDIKMK
ncbi:MAG: hypothetical protein GY870_14900, partial [archaeon]|nr:hypothetical protein [archaeon]